MIEVSIPGYPRIGADRELKKITELYFKGAADEPQLQKAARELREAHWKVQKEHGKAADQFALFGLSHALDFLGDVFNVGLGQFSGAQKPGLLIRPGVEVLFVERGIAHSVVSGCSLTTSAE